MLVLNPGLKFQKGLPNVRIEGKETATKISLFLFRFVLFFLLSYCFVFWFDSDFVCVCVCVVLVLCWLWWQWPWMEYLRLSLFEFESDFILLLFQICDLRRFVYGCYGFFYWLWIFLWNCSSLSLNLASLFIERMMNAMIHWTILWTE
jgi:hypothetical protein